MNEGKFTVSASKALATAEELATRTGGIAGTEHLLVGIVSVENSLSSRLLRRYGVTMEALAGVFTSDPVGFATWSPKVKSIIMQAKAYAVQYSNGYIDVDHLLMGLLKSTDSIAIRVLYKLGIDRNELFNLLLREYSQGPMSSDEDYGEQEERFSFSWRALTFLR